MATIGKFTLRLDSEGINNWLRSNAPPILQDAAEAVAAGIDGPVDIYQEVGRNGRPYALVVFAHPKALLSQAKHGTMTRAAAEAGVDVTRYEVR